MFAEKYLKFQNAPVPPDPITDSWLPVWRGASNRWFNCSSLPYCSILVSVFAHLG
jgi:hypothetical protein